MGRYTLMVLDKNVNLAHPVLLNDIIDGKKVAEKEKVSLTAIDNFTLNNQYLFSSKEEFLDFIATKNNVDSKDLDVYISYQSDKKEKRLEPLFGENRLLQYLSKNYVGLSAIPINDSRLLNFYAEFIKIISNGKFYREIQNSEYINKHFFDNIKAYMYASNSSSSDDINDCRELENSIKKDLSHYKTLRGMVLLTNRYNEKTNENILPSIKAIYPSEIENRNNKIIAELGKYGDVDEALIPDLDQMNSQQKEKIDYDVDVEEFRK